MTRCPGSGPISTISSFRSPGLSGGHDEYVVRGDIDGESFSVLYYRDGTLLSVDAVNAPGDYMAVRKALGQGATISAEAAANRGVALKELIVPQAIGV